MKLTHDYTRSIALISDMHVGSRFGLCPQKFITSSDEAQFVPNTGQKSLLASWKDYCKTMKSFKIDTVFLVGDILSGVNIAETGLFMITTDMNEQLEMATKLLAPLCKGKNVLVWNGTPYHESRDTRIHHFLADYLNGRFMGSISNLQILPSKKIANVAHATTDAMVYPETVLSRDIMFLGENIGLGKLSKVNAIIRGHRHNYVEIHKHDIHYISLPCWEAFSPYYKAVKWYFKMQPDIGGGLMLMDKEERLRFMHFLYPCPHIADKLTSG